MTATARPITQGPKHHWFGYYDKLQFDPAGRRVLGMEVEFEGRSPRADDVIRIGVVDLDDSCAWTELGTSSSWCWQQGCMLQWIPGTASRVLWNDRDGDRFVCHILDVYTGERRTIGTPVYTLCPDGATAIAADFRRINDTRPGYGYPGIPDPNAGVKAPEDSGLWRVDVSSGEATLILSIAEIAGLPYPHGDLRDAKHWFNHVLVNPTGDRIEFLHRWRFGDKGFNTRMLTCGLDGGDVRVVDDSGHSSHFHWRDAHHILVFTRPAGEEWGFYLFDERTGERELVIDDRRNGHCLYMPGNEWILNDTYPQGEDRLQRLYLYRVADGHRRDLGAYRAPKDYAGEWRCDLHARFSPDGTKIVFDSAHGGDGRQMYLVELV